MIWIFLLNRNINLKSKKIPNFNSKFKNGELDIKLAKKAKLNN
jgi:hypothetical protein